jgi:TetR/AcrR family transcriptional repressor of nem operon
VRVRAAIFEWLTNNLGRPLSFDADDALRAAMRAFRVRGYEATTMKDLERATGLLPGSLYHSFGGKKELFLAALDHYNEHVVRKRIETHLLGDAPVEELRALFRSVLDEPGGGHFGCLLTNTAVEFSSASKPVTARVNEGFRLLADAFEKQSRRARALGQGASRRSHRSTGLRLLHAYQGLLVLVRFGHERAELEALIDELVDDAFRGERDDS